MNETLLENAAEMMQDIMHSTADSASSHGKVASVVLRSGPELEASALVVGESGLLEWVVVKVKVSVEPHSHKGPTG